MPDARRYGWYTEMPESFTIELLYELSLHVVIEGMLKVWRKAKVAIAFQVQEYQAVVHATAGQVVMQGQWHGSWLQGML
jgi:hypothetical protein